MRSNFALLLALIPLAAANVITGVPDAAPPGFEEWISPVVVPAKPVAGDADWAGAVAKAKGFVASLSLEEKVNLTTGVGTVGRCVGNTGRVTRLDFNGFCLEDSPLGVRFTDFASAFPAAINVASTFDPDLIHQRGVAMGQEHRGKGVNVALGPMTNMGRVAAGGRNWEGFGADPYLSGVASAQTVKGVQEQGVIACVKHYVGNEQEHFRGGSQAPQIYSSNIDDRTMHEFYSWPFAEAVNVGVGSVMCAYNKVNQTQSCQNSKFLNGILKEELDFQGFILSDWAALINGVQPALAGTDMNMPGFKAYGDPTGSEPNPDNTTDSWWGSALIESVRNGSVPEARVTDMVERTMAAFYKMGQDDPSYPQVNFDYNTEDTTVDGQVVNQHVNVQGDHYKLIRNIGAASTVLLKNNNNNALPLQANKIKRLAILGSDAGPNPDGPNGCGDRGCDQGTLAMGWGSGTANFPYLVDPLAAITTYLHKKEPDTVIEGVLDDFDYAQVTSVSSEADTCIVFANSDSGEGYITVDGNAGDRNNLTLWHGGDTLVATTAAACTNTIVVVHSVGPLIVEPWIDNPNVTAVLWAGLPGQETGNAIVDVLFGAYNPSGRLPYTIAKQRTDYGTEVLYTSSETTPQITYSEGVFVDYRHFDSANIQPRFEFGFGLSYTSFDYSGLRVSQSGGNSRRLNKVRAADPRPMADSSSTAAPQESTSASQSDSASSSGSASSSDSASASTLSGNATSVSSTSASTALPANSTALPANSTTVPQPTNTTTSAPAFSSPAQTHPGGPANLFDELYTVSFTVANSGGVDGHEAPQLYLGFPGDDQPVRVLRGFDRVHITKGDSKKVKFSLRRKDLSVWDVVKQQWSIPSGQFKVEVGASSRNIKLSAFFTPQH